MLNNPASSLVNCYLKGALKISYSKKKGEILGVLGYFTHATILVLPPFALIRDFRNQNTNGKRFQDFHQSKFEGVAHNVSQEQSGKSVNWQ